MPSHEGDRRQEKAVSWPCYNGPGVSCRRMPEGPAKMLTMVSHEKADVGRAGRSGRRYKKTLWAEGLTGYLPQNLSVVRNANAARQW